MEIDRTQCPDFFLDYILYITVTKSLSSRTVQEYYLDIRMFLKYLRMMRDSQYQNTDNLHEIPIKDMQISELESVTLQDLYNYLYYVTEERENHDRARGRKVSALRSFFGYLCHHQNLISYGAFGTSIAKKNTAAVSDIGRKSTFAAILRYCVSRAGLLHFNNFLELRCKIERVSRP